MFLEYEIGYANNVIKIIEDSRNNALKKVNEELIQKNKIYGYKSSNK